MFRKFMQKLNWVDGIRTRMAVLVATVAFLIAPAQAQVLSYEEVLENLSGTWGVPFIDAENGSEEYITDCERLHINIDIEDRGGTLYYSARHGGVDIEDGSPHAQKAERAVHTDGRRLPALQIEYEGETRLDDDGNPFVWYLFMTSEDEFVWSPAHSDLKGFTPTRTRCEINSDIS